MTLSFQFNDGGRSLAGYKGLTGDCVCRSIAIAAGKPYKEVYERLAHGNATQRKGKWEKTTSKRYKSKTAASGIVIQRKWFKEYMQELGFTWVPTMKIGQGCTTHLRAGELPMGKLVVNVSKHCTAVIDGVIHDTYDPSRDGSRCVYGYYIKK